MSIFQTGEAYSGRCALSQPRGGGLILHTHTPPLHTQTRGGGNKPPNSKTLRVSVTWWQYTKQVNNNGREWKRSNPGGGGNRTGGAHLWDKPCTPASLGVLRDLGFFRGGCLVFWVFFSLCFQSPTSPPFLFPPLPASH